MLPRRGKKPCPPAREPLTPARLAELFPDARMVCECPSMLEVCPATCDRFAGKRKAMRDWFATAEVVDAAV